MKKIIHKKNDCIGCGLCAEVAPHYWHMNDDGIAELNNICKKTDTYDYAKAFQEDLNELEKAQNSCPVQIININ